MLVLSVASSLLLSGALAAPRTTIDIPFERLETGRIVVPVTIDGYTAPFVVDRLQHIA